MEPEGSDEGVAGPSRSESERTKKRGPYKGYLWDNSIPIPRTTIISRLTSRAPTGVVAQPQKSGDALVQPTYCDDLPDDQDLDMTVQHCSNLSEDESNSGLTDDTDDEDNVLQHTEAQDVEPELDLPDNEQGPCAGFNQKIDYIKKYKLNDPLHHHAPITKLSVLLMILHMAVRHCNTQAFVESQIRFVNTLFGENVLDISYFIYRELFKPTSKIEKHYFCPNCQKVVGCSSEINVKAKYLKCLDCENDVDVHSVDSGNYFISLSCRNQIEELMRKPGIKLIPSAARFTHCISDIYDGALYQELLKDGFPLSNVNAITVTFNTDGVAIHESTKNSLWPIWLYVNELCPTQRFKTENLILAGLWFGKSAPIMSMFLKPFINQLLELSTDGVIVDKPNGLSVKCPVFAIGCSVDSVAKAKIMCQKQFNACSGCLYCHHPNDTHIGTDRLHRFYDTSTKYDERSEESILKDMVQADELHRNGYLKSNEGVNGFLGISILVLFSKLLNNFACNTFHIVWSVTIDYMHCLLEGVARRLLDLFNSILTEENLKILEERILVITPPREMTRRPRSFSSRNHWKAKEFRAFILYYALPCLEGLLPQRYYDNLKLFVHPCHILLGDKISPSELSEARTELEKFTVTFQKLYGIKNVTYNLHLCTHLVDMVVKLGPLWCYSNFVFESGNGYLVRLVRGTRTVINEIASKYLTISTASRLSLENNVTSEAEQFCSYIMNHPYSMKYECCEGVQITGSYSKTIVSQEECAMLLEKGVHVSDDNSLVFYNRVIKDNVLFCSNAYCKGKVYDDSCVQLKNESYAVIEKVLKTTSNSLVCLIKPIHIALDDSCIIPQIKRCSHDLFDDVTIVPFSDILRKCILVKFEDKAFVCKIPNFFEHD